MAVWSRTAPMTDESSGSGFDLVLGTARLVLTFLWKNYKYQSYKSSKSLILIILFFDNVSTIASYPLSCHESEFSSSEIFKNPGKIGV